MGKNEHHIEKGKIVGKRRKLLPPGPYKMEMRPTERVGGE